MKFNIYGFKQEMLVNQYSTLNGNDIIVLRVIADILPRMTRIENVDGKEFRQITYTMILEDIPFVTKSVSTLKKIVQKLVDSGLIERHIKNKGGKFTYFRATKALMELEYKESVQTVIESPVKKVVIVSDAKESGIKIDIEDIASATKIKGTSSANDELKELMTRPRTKKIATKDKTKKSNFNSYQQRTYDFDELERKLLGWDK